MKTIALGFCFSGAAVIITRIALQFGTIANPTTVGFAFLILVVLSAVLANLSVAIVTSVVATLLFNFFFFPPIGTFVIADFHNWVALFVFLFTSIVISRLTSSALENARNAKSLEATVHQMKEFGQWLLSLPQEVVTLSELAEGTRRIFDLEYCSIHVYAEGKWHHFSGTSVDALSRQVAEMLKVRQDHPTGVIELAEEQSLGVRYSPIRTPSGSFALLVVKREELTMEAVDAIASMIGVLLLHILRNHESAV